MEKKDDNDPRSESGGELDEMETPIPGAKEPGSKHDSESEAADGGEDAVVSEAADDSETEAKSESKAPESKAEDVPDSDFAEADAAEERADQDDGLKEDDSNEIDYDDEPTIDLAERRGERKETAAASSPSSASAEEGDPQGRELVAVDLADHLETYPLTFHQDSDDVATDAQQQLEPILVQVEGLIKHYGPVRAVDGIDMVVRRGDVLAFLGPNGAGKTTAMKMITGFLEPDAGSVSVCGHDLAHESLEARRRIGYLPENAPSYGDMTPRSFLRFIAAARGLDRVASKIDAVVARTGLESVIDRAIDNLSKGFKRRVGLAQALIHDPEILILDEPTDGLDPNQKLVVQDLISSLSAEKSIVVSTHILDEAERICNRAIILSEGKIIVDSTPAELLLKAPLHNVIKVRFERHLPQRVLGRVREVEWCESAALLEDGTLLISPRDGRNHLHHVLAQLEGEPVADIRLIEGRLEDLFRELTKGVAA